MVLYFSSMGLTSARFLTLNEVILVTGAMVDSVLLTIVDVLLGRLDLKTR